MAFNYFLSSRKYKVIPIFGCCENKICPLDCQERNANETIANIYSEEGYNQWSYECDFGLEPLQHTINLWNKKYEQAEQEKRDYEAKRNEEEKRNEEAKKNEEEQINEQETKNETSA